MVLPPKDITVCDLIAFQRRLACSKDRFERCFGTLLVAGMLDERLARLTDRQIGQLLFYEVGTDLGIAQPESMICHQATQRLIRSPGGKLTPEDMEKQCRRPPCPKCGNEMLLHYGIDEPDFFQCVSLACGHKIEESNA